MAWRGAAVGVLALLVICGTAAAAPYLQFGVDAARTGVTEDPGPVAFDVAFTTNLPSPGLPAYLSVPLVIGDAALALIEGEGFDGLYRVDLASTNVSRIVTFDGPPSSIASDGDVVFVAGPLGIAAYGLDGSGPSWEWPFPALHAGGGRTRCAPLALDGGDLFAACSQGSGTAAAALDQLHGPFPGPVGDPLPNLADPAPASFVVALDASTGRERWSWEWARPECVVPLDVAECVIDEANDPVFTSLAVGGDVVVVAGTQFAVYSPRTSAPSTEYSERIVVAALERGDGSPRWHDEPVTALDYPRGTNVPAPALVVTADTVYVLALALVALAPEDGTERWSEVVTPADVGREGDPAPVWHGSGLAVVGSRLYASGADEVVAFDIGTGQPTRVWQRPFGGGADLDQMYGLIVWGDNLLGTTFQGDAFVLSTLTGELRYFDEHAGSNGGLRVGIGDGAIAIIAPFGRITVLGQTPASIQPVATLSSGFPEPNEAMSVDLSQSGPGALGPPTEFQVDWGDGHVDAWQTSPLLEHAYTSAGVVNARAFARNDAGQVASQTFTVHVGGSRPNLVSTAFAPDNQDLTFGILGIALAMGGGLFAVARTRTRRRRVQRELAAIEKAHAETRDRPRECEAALAERRAHVQGLGLDGKLDQGEVVMLQQRIDELARDVRLGTLDREFHFLPHGFVLSLKEMLADGVVSVWEHEHLLHALERDRSMTKAQKGKVRVLLDEWAERDGGDA